MIENIYEVIGDLIRALGREEAHYEDWDVTYMDRDIPHYKGEAEVEGFHLSIVGLMNNDYTLKYSVSYRGKKLFQGMECTEIGLDEEDFSRSTLRHEVPYYLPAWDELLFKTWIRHGLHRKNVDKNQLEFGFIGEFYLV